jgi:hypothetical protein
LGAGCAFYLNLSGGYPILRTSSRARDALERAQGALGRPLDALERAQDAFARAQDAFVCAARDAFARPPNPLHAPNICCTAKRDPLHG